MPLHAFPRVCRVRTYVTHCNTLLHTATHCNTLQHTATHCNTAYACALVPGCRQRLNICDALQHTATHCNTLQHTATQLMPVHLFPDAGSVSTYLTHCNTLQHAAMQLMPVHAFPGVGSIRAYMRNRCLFQAYLLGTQCAQQNRHRLQHDQWCLCLAPR